MKTKVVLLLLVILVLTATAAQPPEDRGAMGLAQALNRLDVVASVLHTGAHPDDENSALLSWLSRGQGARTAYLSITRGDGGQNLLGTELFEDLGVIRTEELLAARRLDGAQQFFTPEYEFGFSKTAEEGLEKWGHDKVLGDFVRVIRQFRPEIIVSRFTGTPADGHGHHQIAGIITQEAFKAAADPKLYPEYGKPWQAKKLYLNGGGRGGQGQGQGQGQAQGRGQAPGQGQAQGQAQGRGQAQGQAQAQPQPVGMTINVGEFDLALGPLVFRNRRRRTQPASIAVSGRRLKTKAPATPVFNWSRNRSTLPTLPRLFDGVIYKIKDLAQLDASITADADGPAARIAAIRQKVNLLRPAEIVPDLTASLQLLAAHSCQIDK